MSRRSWILSLGLALAAAHPGWALPSVVPEVPATEAPPEMSTAPADLLEAVADRRFPGQHDPRTALGALRWKVWGRDYPEVAAWARDHRQAALWAAAHPEAAEAALGAPRPGLSDAAMAAMTAPSPASPDVVAPPPPSLLAAVETSPAPVVAAPAPPAPAPVVAAAPPAAAPTEAPPAPVVAAPAPTQVAAAPQPTVEVQTPTVTTDGAGTRTVQTRVTTRAPGPHGGTTVVTVPVVVPIVLAQTGPAVTAPAMPAYRPAPPPAQAPIPASALEVAPAPALRPASYSRIQPHIPQGRYRVVRYEPSTGRRFEVRKPVPAAPRAPAVPAGWWY